MKKQTVAEYLVARLAKLGITGCFGVPGDFAFPPDDAIASSKSVNWRGCSNELNASYAADGYARMRGASMLWVSILAALAVGVPAVASAEGTEDFNRHSVELFLGAGTRFADGESPTGFAVGLGYEFRFVQWVGVGVSGEYVTGDVRDGILLFPVYIHPWRGLRFEMAPGVEFSDEPEAFAVRFGASYEVELWRDLSISPEINADLVDGETTLVYGASLGWGF